MNGIEPHWNKIRPFVLQSADQFKPVPPPLLLPNSGTVILMCLLQEDI